MLHRSLRQAAVLFEVPTYKLSHALCRVLAAGEGAGKKGPMADRIRGRLAKMGLGNKQQQQPLAAAAAAAAAEPPPTAGLLGSAGARPGQLHSVAEEAGSSAGVDAGHFGGGPGGDSASGSGSGLAVRTSQKISSGFQAMGRGLSKVKLRLASDRQDAAAAAPGGAPAGDELADHDQDVAILLGLAAFAVSGVTPQHARIACLLVSAASRHSPSAACVHVRVWLDSPRSTRSCRHLTLANQAPDQHCPCPIARLTPAAFIKSVLCPSMTPRVAGSGGGGGGDSAGPGTPTASAAAALALRGHHRATSSFGSMSMRVDDLMLRELDRVLEARSELDSLEGLAACPLLAQRPQRAQRFLHEAPLLLSPATTLDAFGARLQQLLFPQDGQLLAWAGAV